MLNLTGRSATFCDGVSRRSALQVGALGLGGFGFADILRARAANPEKVHSKTSVIFVELAGGPTQFETYDPKPQAPVEYRGEFGTVNTSLPGVFYGEHMPRQAAVAEKLAIVRSIHHPSNSHDPSSHLTQTGYYKQGPKGGPNQMPAFGCAVAKLRGPNATTLPPYVAIPRVMRNGGPSYLGKSYNPFETVGDPSKKDFQVQNLTLNSQLNLRRLEDRRGLLGALDAQRRLGRDGRRGRPHHHRGGQGDQGYRLRRCDLDRRDGRVLLRRHRVRAHGDRRGGPRADAQDQLLPSADHGRLDDRAL